MYPRLFPSFIPFPFKKTHNKWMGDKKKKIQLQTSKFSNGTKTSSYSIGLQGFWKTDCQNWKSEKGSRPY